MLPAAASAYVFDFDGTLGSIPVDWAAVKEGLREITGSEDELPSVFPTIIQLLKDRPKETKKAFDLIDKYELAALPSASLYPKSVELLASLAEVAKVSLVTMQGAKATELVLERFGLKQYLLCYFTREDSLDRAEQVRFALNGMRAKKESSVFVGDRLNDLNAAKLVGIPFTMIRTHGDDPEDAGVTLYHSIGEFLDAIRAG
ncbi:MAG: HAD family hydrolase [Thaumarchaeota archaeon]|nr:HAD family hydrolase [Nitrososphaerota archaeon]